MQCPKCHDTLQRLAEPHDDVFRCAGCKGMWFEIMAHENLREDAEVIDLVTPAERQTLQHGWDTNKGTQVET